MTARDQVALFLFVVCFGGVGILWLLDWAGEILDNYLVREKAWRAIDRRCAMERHPAGKGL